MVIQCLIILYCNLVGKFFRNVLELNIGYVVIFKDPIILLVKLLNLQEK